LIPQVFQTYKWLLTSEQVTKVAGWVKKAVQETFSGKKAEQSGPASSSGAASSSAAGKKQSKADADSASVMHLFG